MSVIIRSDQRATKSIGNIYGILGPIDFAGIIDFNLGMYRIRDGESLVDVSIQDAISFLRPTAGEYTGRDGVTRVAAAGEPRIHYLSSQNVAGLLLEDSRANLLANPRSPATQTIQTSSAGLAQGLALTVEGSGSATMSGDVSDLSTVAATEGSPQGAILVNPGSGTRPITVTVSGELTRFQLEKTPGSTGGPYASTFVPDGVATRGADTVMLSDVFEGVLGAASGTIVVQFIDHPRLVTLPLSSIINVAGLQDTNNPKGGLYMQRLFASSGARTISLKGVTPNTSTIAKTFNMASPDAIRNTIAFAYDNAGQYAAIAHNGSATENTEPLSLTPPNRLTLGGPDGFHSQNGYAGGLLTRVVLYDRRLTREEIVRISTSWL